MAIGIPRRPGAITAEAATSGGTVDTREGDNVAGPLIPQGLTPPGEVEGFPLAPQAIPMKSFFGSLK